MSVWSQIMAGLTAFKEAYVTDGLLDRTLMSDYNTFEGRKLRYAMLWAWYENTAYRRLQRWSQAYKTQYGLYKYIRNIHNPAYRLVEFWKMMIWGGSLDRDAGEKGAIPIVTENDTLRASIATLWKDSNWQTEKGIAVMNAAALGDVGLKIVDDPDKGIVTLEVIRPQIIKSITTDKRGYVKAYELEEDKADPEVTGGVRWVKFREQVERDGDDVVYRTFKDDTPYAWNGVASEWSQPYGFVPFVTIQHNNVGGMWGWAEIHPMRSKINEADDLASKIDDYIRKAIDPIWLFNFRKPKTPIDLSTATTTPTENRPEPGREEVSAIYVDSPNAKAQPLVTDQLDVEKFGKRLMEIIEEIEREFPELQMDIWTAGGYTTGKALKTARQRVERKVIDRRPGYDDQLVRAHQMAVAIGGFRGYAGYEGFGLDSYANGDLDHTIPSARPIFNPDEADDVTVTSTEWSTIIAAKNAGLPLDEVLKDLGWSTQRIAEFETKMKKLEAEAQRKAEQFAERAAQMTGAPDNSGAPGNGANNQNAQPDAAEENA